MSRIVVTSPATVPGFAGSGQPAVLITKGSVIEATPAMLTAITSAGGTYRTVLTATQGDALGEISAVSNATT